MARIGQIPVPVIVMALILGALEGEVGEFVFRP